MRRDHLGQLLVAAMMMPALPHLQLVEGLLTTVLPDGGILLELTRDRKLLQYVGGAADAINLLYV